VTVTYRHSEDYCFEDAAERLSAFAEHRGPQLGPVYPLSVAQLQATLGYCRDEVFVGTPRLAQELGVSHSILAGAEAVLQILEWLPVLVVRKGRRIVFINGDEFVADGKAIGELLSMADDQATPADSAAPLASAAASSTSLAQSVHSMEPGNASAPQAMLVDSVSLSQSNGSSSVAMINQSPAAEAKAGHAESESSAPVAPQGLESKRSTGRAAASVPMDVSDKLPAALARESGSESAHSGLQPMADDQPAPAGWSIKLNVGEGGSLVDLKLVAPQAQDQLPAKMGRPRHVDRFPDIIPKTMQVVVGVHRIC
jgi:hypothetical protein